MAFWLDESVGKLVHTVAGEGLLVIFNGREYYERLVPPEVI